MMENGVSIALVVQGQVAGEVNLGYTYDNTSSVADSLKTSKNITMLLGVLHHWFEAWMMTKCLMRASGGD